MLKNRTTLTLAATAALVIGVLSGCSAPPSTPNSPNETPSADGFEEYQLAFAQCMRDSGFDVPDPTGGGMEIAQGGDEAGFIEAADACSTELGDPPVAEGSDPMNDEERIAESIEIAECFRENGIDVPDPKTGELLSIPLDAPQEVLEECFPGGGMVPAGPEN